MGMANGTGLVYAFGSEDNVPELLCVMENGSMEQSAEAAQALFEELCLENGVHAEVCALIEPLLDILTVRYKSVAKASILNGIAQVLRSVMDNHLPFGVTPYHYRHAGDCESREIAYQVKQHWIQMLRQRYEDWTSLVKEDEMAAVQAVYVLHLLQWTDEAVENTLQEAALHGSTARVRLNGLLALADYRRRIGKPFNPSIAFGQHQDDELHEAIRAVCIAVTAPELIGHLEMSRLISGCTLPRFDRIQFPWADGAIAAVCAQAACLSLSAGATLDERAAFWKEALEKTISAHQRRSRQVVWEIGESTVQWDEEWLQWNWNSPMLVADGMLYSLFQTSEQGTAIMQKQEDGTMSIHPAAARVIKICLQNQVEMPNAERYGAGMTIRSLYRFVT
ncbi:hypothetical protein M5X00_01400 [Paenibacillus alvei]|nr:hypothetical protein [Paenibacillus alvei]EJW18486.1 hypothetical protein PAV_2c02500 [Paenibacillus alvei DSM 29]MCY9539653.1 hypothetical protein [Paenibacillus alvei]MCY9735604.1 hypothetical protein [Paenibacillus alvei]MCY9752915.1 hypothetical protein [Paenibacillus alvei]MEC0081150.1 hypothetical protein [Paenibacillus alvei]